MVELCDRILYPVSAGQPSYFFLLVQAKVTKKKDTRRLAGIFNPNPLRFKSKTGAAQRTLTGFIMDTPTFGSR